MTHKTQRPDDRLLRYDYYLLGGITPIRVLIEHDGLPYGAEKPGESGKWVNVPTMLGKLDRYPEEFQQIGEKEFDVRVREFINRTQSFDSPCK